MIIDDEMRLLESQQDYFVQVDMDSGFADPQAFIKNQKNFEERTGIRGIFEPNQDFGGDGILTLCFQNKKNKFLVHTQREYRMHQLVEFDKIKRGKLSRPASSVCS